MNIEEKIKKLENSINIQLGNFVSIGNIQIPVHIFVDNTHSDALNTVEVSSLEEAEEICFRITKTKNLDNRTLNENAPKFLTLIASLPN